MRSLKERRKIDKERVKRWRDRCQMAGGHSLQVMLSPEARSVLESEREKTGESFTAIVNKAILLLREGLRGHTR